MERATQKQPHSTATTVVQRNQIITQTKPFSSVSSVPLTSTPYQSTPNRNGRNTNYDINNITIAEANTDMDIGRNCCAPDILCESTGFAMSPISHNQISNDLDGYDDQTLRLNLNVSELTTHGQEQFLRSANTISIFSENETTDNGISNCYYTEDIIEVLSEHGSASFPAYEESPNSSLKSEGSFTTLGRIFQDNDEPKDIGDIVIHQRYADDTDLTENNRKTLSSHAYISKADFTRSAYRQSLGNVSLDVARKANWDNTTTHFKKSFTLPRKIKMNHKSQNGKACLQNDDDMKKSDTFIVNDYSQMQTPIVLRQEAPVNNGNSKDSIDEFTTWGNSYEFRTTRQDIACDDDFLPHSDDDSNSVCDIDEYTLTVTSETTTEAKDDLGENTSISSNFENELESDSAEVESTNKQLTHTMRNRSDSFIVAVSGSIFEDDVKEQTDNITAMASYLDAERVYCNYGFREDESSIATGSRDSSHVQPHITNTAQNECSAIDVMAFF
ncbi:hypothetical protein DPMN_084241 [Dreissena polymorpha]|uniref:Uncharacterized protein n=1 Tax=Dreissena polymorpha TaxID=45954 RepID=A0A9D3YDZ7_DREPO|nr:hypothetical protein DPMN_084241 [Dreissena polymorpha]